jgi:hypothetical protein
MSAGCAIPELDGDCCVEDPPALCANARPCGRKNAAAITVIFNKAVPPGCGGRTSHDFFGSDCVLKWELRGADKVWAQRSPLAAEYSATLPPKAMINCVLSAPTGSLSEPRTKTASTVRTGPFVNCNEGEGGATQACTG